MNSVKWAGLLALLGALFVGIGYFVADIGGMIFAGGLALAINLVSYWYSDKIVLTMYKAQPLEPGQAPRIHAMADRLSHNAGIPKPRLYLVQNPTPNAFATGRNPANAAVAVTSGLVSILSEAELEGVLAHEIAHVKNRDTLIGTIAATLAVAITMIARLAMFAAIFGGMSGDRDRGGGGLGALLMIIVAPIAAMIIQFAISRSREYGADALGARLSGNPRALAGALKRISAGVERIPMKQAEPATAHLFIMSPFKGRGRGMAGLFSTHPPIEERVRRLQKLA